MYSKNEERILEKEMIVNKTLDKYLKDINLENNLIKASKQEFEEMMAKWWEN